ncbi:formyltetrahydrofolate deformylase [Bacillus thermotolerans]|uniref:Formyltetrahydrofolate deformylase n=1 Tax=Bacillus thermotolerans TaxID=1221996 RepID=A0A0F5I6L6_BACTR|nr:formyltetrahydrofolate deformylase [Bacillus thermotolerans]KKB40144.1 Formyltetrahydrofolate deformylase [Bacillus thermotolerans]KKB41078.1 Formyltetrahydrofolate deformylase [Bacillus thermotolerans]
MNTNANSNPIVYEENARDRGALLVKCPDRPGIVAAISKFLADRKANIVESNQHSSDPQGGTFFIRVEFECPQLNEKRAAMEAEFESLAESFSMDYRFTYRADRKRTAIFVSKETHCLLELLWEWQSGDLPTDIVMVISNHEEARGMVEALGIPFYYIPANKDIRKQVEEKQIALLKEKQIDVIILARYMQILTSDFVSEFPDKIINIHHSFLPAFIGARPYERAYARGVKLIGATSHYVTNDLDEGPIIEQDIERVNHRDHVADLKKIGRSIERRVLARAVKWHLEDRVIVHENKTIVFE